MSLPDEKHRYLFLTEDVDGDWTQHRSRYVTEREVPSLDDFPGSLVPAMRATRILSVDLHGRLWLMKDKHVVGLSRGPLLLNGEEVSQAFNLQETLLAACEVAYNAWEAFNEALGVCFDHVGADHIEGCPGDDTCSCAHLVPLLDSTPKMHAAMTEIYDLLRLYRPKVQE